METESYNTALRLCGSMVSKFRGDEELLLFPELPRWVIVKKGCGDLLRKINRLSLNEICATVSAGEYQFILDAIQAGILIYDEELSTPDEKQADIYPLLSVWLNITSSCNLRCRHCFLGDGKKDTCLLSVNDIDHLMNEFLKVKGTSAIALDITGGEPLLRKDFLDIVKVCKRDGIRVSVPTNGLLLTPHIIKVLVDEGVPIVISLDGCNTEDHEFIRGSNTFNKTVKNIKEAVYQGADVTLSYTVHKKNQNSVIEYLNFAKTLGVKTVNYSFLNEIGNALVNGLLLADEDVVVHKTLIEALNDPEVFELLQGSNCSRKLETVLLPIKMDCCGTGLNTCAIGANGDVYPCPSFQNPNYSAGNVLKSNFSDLWNDPNTFKKFRDLRVDTLNGECSICDLRYLCGGGCRAQACHGDIKELNAHSSKCEMYKRTLYDLMWMLVDHPELSKLKTEVGANFFH